MQDLTLFSLDPFFSVLTVAVIDSSPQPKKSEKIFSYIKSAFRLQPGLSNNRFRLWFAIAHTI